MRDAGLRKKETGLMDNAIITLQHFGEKPKSLTKNGKLLE